MLRRLNNKKVSISGRRDRADLQTLFGAEAVVDVLQFLYDTDVGKKIPEKAIKLIRGISND